MISIVWQQISKLIGSIRSRTNTTNKRKMKIFLWLIDLKFRLWPMKQKGLWISKEKHCCHNGLPWPKKRLSYEKCIFFPVVDYKFKSQFYALIVYIWSIKLQKCFHVSKLTNYPSEISSLIKIRRIHMHVV